MFRDMTPRHWWLGVAAVVMAIVFHAAWPRYEWRQRTGGGLIRIDRWAGTAEIGRWHERRWVGAPDPLAIRSFEPEP